MQDKRERPADLARKFFSDPVHLLAFGLGIGLVPPAPGTLASAATAAGFWFLKDLPLLVYAGGVLLLSAAGIAICGISARRLGVHDFGGIVLDEVAGMLIAMLWTPPSLVLLLVGFGLFRLFDIWKPWPIRTIDSKLGGGLGIMLDDVLAGCLAWLGVQVVLLTGWY